MSLPARFSHARIMKHEMTTVKRACVICFLFVFFSKLLSANTYTYEKKGPNVSRQQFYVINMITQI